MRAEYSHAKIPPARMPDVQFSPPGESSLMNPTAALIDTGSDFTLAPLSLSLRIDAPEARSAYLRGLWSKQRQVTLYLVDLHLANRVLAGIEVVGVEDRGKHNSATRMLANLTPQKAFREIGVTNPADLHRANLDNLRCAESAGEGKTLRDTVLLTF